jgi:predicted nucleotidyltransferase
VPSDDLTASQRERIATEIRRVAPAAIAGYVFGSFATGTSTPNSDVDVAVLGSEALPAAARWELAQTLAIALGRDVDLIDLRQAICGASPNTRCVRAARDPFCAPCDGHLVVSRSDRSRPPARRAEPSAYAVRAVPHWRP